MENKKSVQTPNILATEDLTWIDKTFKSESIQRLGLPTELTNEINGFLENKKAELNRSKNELVDLFSPYWGKFIKLTLKKVDDEENPHIYYLMPVRYVANRYIQCCCLDTRANVAPLNLFASFDVYYKFNNKVIEIEEITEEMFEQKMVELSTKNFKYIVDKYRSDVYESTKYGLFRKDEIHFMMT
jgi:hypothetical protein